MKIKTVGTGGVPAKQRSSCTLIDNKILIDCGNGIVKTLLEQNVDINKIDVLLITHLHGDHFLDLPSLIIQRKIIQATNELNIYCPNHFKGILSSISDNSLKSSNIYFNAEKNFRLEIAILR